MRKLKARTLGLGLSALILPACTPGQEFLVPMPAPATVEVSNSAPTTTVKRLPQAASTTPSFVAMSHVPVPGQIVYDSQGRAYQAVAVEPQTPAASIPSVTQDAVEVVAVTHTPEPPLATAPQTSKPQLVRQMPEAPPVPLPVPPNPPKLPHANANGWIPTYVPPGAQVLVLQSQGTTAENAKSALKPVAHTSSASDPLPNLLTPPVPAEELKLVSVPKTDVAMTGSAVMNALRAYQDKAGAEADRHLAHLDPVNQQLLRRLLPLAVKLGETGAPAADPSEVADLVDQLQHLLVTLQSRAALRIEKLCYCKPARPAKQGVYQPLAEDHAFRTGESVELYMELRNFTCEAKDRGYTTHLTTLVEICDEHNEVVAKYEFERDKPDAGQAPRSDYFHICRFPVQGLASGPYTLNATVTDVPSGKSAKKSLPLKVDAGRRSTAVR